MNATYAYANTLYDYGTNLSTSLINGFNNTLTNIGEYTEDFRLDSFKNFQLLNTTEMNVTASIAITTAAIFSALNDSLKPNPLEAKKAALIAGKIAVAAASVAYLTSIQPDYTAAYAATLTGLAIIGVPVALSYNQQKNVI